MSEPVTDAMPLPEGGRSNRGRRRPGQADSTLGIDHPATRLAGFLRLMGARRRTQRALRLAEQADGLAKSYAGLGESAFVERRNLVAQALRRGGVDGPAMVDGLALVREATRRAMGLTPYREQLAAAAALISGHVVEMATGEGKTIAAALPAALQALSGRFVHVVTSNDYLAQRDAEHLAPLHGLLGLSCGFVVQGMPTPERRAGYASDILHLSNKELVFDFLRDRLLTSGAPSERAAVLKARQALGLLRGQQQPIQRGLDVCIVDEIDSVLIDEAGTPLIISAPADSLITAALAEEALALARQLSPGGHFERIGDTIGVEISDAGHAAIDAIAADLESPDWRQQVRRDELARAAITATHILQRDRHYIVREGKIVIVDENTGRTMPDRFWGDALHPMVEQAQGCAISPLRRSLAAISFQRFFRRYPLISGMSGTVSEVALELSTVFGMPLTPIPRRRPLRRVVLPRRVFPDRESLWQEAAQMAGDLARRGQPVLIGVGSVREADHASQALAAHGVPHRVLSAAQDEAEAEAVAQAGRRGAVTVATNMAGRGTDIALGEEVAALGGLAVLLCERHASRRVDRQLMGRCARQGDPGLVIELLSREDGIVNALPDALVAPARRLCASPRLAALVFKLAQDHGEAAAARQRYGLVRRDEKVAKMLGFAGGLG